MPGWLVNREEERTGQNRPAFGPAAGGGATPRNQPNVARRPNQPNRPNTPNQPNRGGGRGRVGPDRLVDPRFERYQPGDDLGYYDPQPGKGGQQTGFGRFLFEQNPEVGYQWFLKNRTGLDPFGEDAIPDPFDSYLRDQYGQVQQQYDTALMDRPNLKFRKFLQKNLQGGALDADTLRQGFYSQSPMARGETGGPVSSRWVPW